MAPASLLNERTACGRIDRPPHDCCYLRFPDSFGRRFAVFVDTEEEFDWSGPFSRSERSTRATGALPGLHAMLRDHGAQPVYLVDHPIATEPHAAAMLRQWQEEQQCVIGAHLHPWVNPPFSEEVTNRNSFAGNLPIAVERAKIAELTEAIEHAFGRRPTIYRAGRHGVGPNTALILHELGYRFDVSVTALHDYSARGGPDFSAIKPFPYQLGDGDLFELPQSAAYVGALGRLGERLYPAMGGAPAFRGLMARSHLLGRVALTPEHLPLGDVIAALERLIEDGLQLFSLSFHSPSAAPGYTPYVRDKEDLRRFNRWWDGIFAFFERHGIVPASMAQIDAAVRAAGRLHA